MKTDTSHDNFDLETLIARCREAKQIVCVLDEMIVELRGFLDYLELVGDIANSTKFKHLTVQNMIKRVHRRIFNDVSEVYKYRNVYQELVANYEHKVGHVEYKPLRSVMDFSIAFEELLEMFPKEVVMRDFLDE